MFMFITALVFTTIVTVVKITNEDRIERNRKIKLQRTILNVLGLNRGKELAPEKISEIYNKRIKEGKIGDRTIYTCYDDDGKTVTGYAFPVDGPGFWGPVYAMAAVDPDATKLLGISFYRHSETPGLGGRISEDWFSGQFKGLSLELTGKEKQYFHLTPEGDKKRDNDLDAITGASRTSDAVEIFLNRELKVVVEEIKK
jgi:Na+-transporting NADH:ubiquinone oxidoreductase subunit C